MDLISIIVPIYNVEKFLDTCISSLVNQTYKKLEIILVDDGSEDNSGIICDKWASKDFRIKVIHKTNGGLSDARNVGLEEAKGKYVALVDSYDWIDLNYYETLYRELSKSKAQIAASGVTISYSNHEDKTRYNQKAGVYTPEEALRTIQNNEGFLAVAWNKLYKIELFQKIRYPYGIIHEDEFVTYRVVSHAECLVLCTDVFYHYRQREGSIMTEANCEKEKDVLDAYINRMILFKQKFPQLYLKDKYLFCLACYQIFQLAKDQNNVKIMCEVMKKRNEITVPISEFFKFSTKEKLYVLGSKWLLPLFYIATQWRKK